MASYVTVHYGEDEARPVVLQQRLPEGKDGKGGVSFRIPTDSDERRYFRALVEDHRRMFREAVRSVRISFWVRMRLIGAEDSE